MSEVDIRQWLDETMKKGRKLEMSEKAYFQGCQSKAATASACVALLTVSSIFLLRNRISMPEKIGLGLLGFTINQDVLQSRDRSCINKFIQHDTPLAADLRSFLREKAPQHPGLVAFDKLRKDADTIQAAYNPTSTGSTKLSASLGLEKPSLDAFGDLSRGGEGGELDAGGSLFTDYKKSFDDMEDDMHWELQGNDEPRSQEGYKGSEDYLPNQEEFDVPDFKDDVPDFKDNNATGDNYKQPWDQEFDDETPRGLQEDYRSRNIYTRRRHHRRHQHQRSQQEEDSF